MRTGDKLGATSHMTPFSITGSYGAYYENWAELRLKGNAPERRSYHSSFVYDNKLFIFGGLDIRVGSINTLWELNLSNMRDLDNDDGYKLETFGWKKVQTSGNDAARPDKIAYHTSVVFKDNMYLFGGNNYKSMSEDDCPQPFLSYLNLRTMGWQQIKTRGDIVQQRDEHTAVINKETGQMVIFGGFMQGTRTNETSIFNITANNWVNVKFPRGEALPCPRSGHSASIYNGSMYIFGGKDENSEKINDLWCFNIADQMWKRIQLA